jgi:glyoxylase-like metal-dependent hydrolase (beta-lactamase superfamily II)
MKSEQQDYLFEQFRVERGCLGYIVADPETKLAAIVDPEAEMAKPMLGFAFKHSLKFGYVVDTHVHADHVSRARNLKTKPEPKLVMHEMASSIAVDSLESDFILDPEGVTDIICPKVWGMVRCKE